MFPRTLFEVHSLTLGSPKSNGPSIIINSVFICPFKVCEFNLEDFVLSLYSYKLTFRVFVVLFKSFIVFLLAKLQRR
jgi:hypothetical protein